MEIDQSLDLKREHPFDKAVLYTATALFALTIVLTSVQVLVRLLSIQSLGFVYLTQPLARITLIIGTYLGTAVALRNNEHISIQFLLQRLMRWNPKVGLTVRFLGNLIVIAFLAIATWAMYRGTVEAWTTSLGGAGFVMSGQVYLLMGVGIAIALIYAVIDLIKMVRSARSGQTLHAGLVEEASNDE
ncbi:TRAP transporter small permease [Halarchaeum salinum]|uniref:Tripartite ATP-independent periplasmic transporters DctQ component domain-containing protein n=1 Tax=Halarchaeum salinum TaxID=489912 RepID=A0AAV3SA03_9EURY